MRLMAMMRAESLAQSGHWATLSQSYLALFSQRLRDHVLLSTTLLQLLPELLHFLLHVLDLLKEFQQQKVNFPDGKQELPSGLKILNLCSSFHWVH